MESTKEKWVSDGREYEYLLTRKKIKRIRLHVHQDGSLTVSAPFCASLAQIEKWLMTQSGFVDKAREKRENTPLPPMYSAEAGEILPVFGVPHTILVEAGRRVGVRAAGGQILLTVKNPDNREERVRVLKNWMWQEAKRTLTALCRKVYPQFAPDPAEFPTLVFREMVGRWGVCRPTRNTVTLNLNLFYFPISSAEYVVYHEFAHFRHPDHSPAYWAWLTDHLPDCRERRTAMRAYRIPMWGAL